MFGLGVLLLLYWYIHTRQTALTVTDSELLYERGILSKDRTSVSLKHVCAVHVTQGFLNRILGVGTIQISTAGDRRSSRWRTCRTPARSERRSRKRRTKERIRTGMPSAHDDRDHKETRLLLAAAVALILLVAIVWGGIYYFVEYANFSDPFAAGLGLKNAALISFGVSLAVILVMAVVSGGDAIFGELPFHHRRVSDFLRDLLADDRLDLLGRAYSEGPSVWACGRVDGAAAFCCAGRPTSC